MILPSSFFEKEKSYVFFSHTIKGQPYNMEMLRSLVDRKCTLLDYELVTDEKGQAKVEFLLPPNGGEFRFTARAITAETFVGDTPVGAHLDGPINGLTPPFAGLPFQGVSSLVHLGGHSWAALQDNGFGGRANSADYPLHVFQLRLDLDGGGGLGVGAIGIWLPNVFGVGYSTISMALTGALPVTLLGVLLVAKIAATSITIGSGGSGGIFAPSLFLGAATGGLLGAFIHQAFPEATGTSGACDGACEGTCQGECTGTCEVIPPSATCEGSCKGGCSVEYTAPKCEAELERDVGKRIRIERNRGGETTALAVRTIDAAAA